MKRATSQPPVLAGYEFIRLLGSGGFSDVFLYEQQLPRRQVAVKVLLTEVLTPQTRKQFVAEANVMARLSAHPYIVTIFQADVAEDGRPYFVMEYCPGPSLATRYRSERFAVEEALKVGVRLSSAVATAHAAGILHRDIKPANVLTGEYGSPELTDFGISGTTDDELIGHTTTLSRELAGGTSSTTVGLSVPWSPPEMFAEDPAPDVRSDIFSLAATIFTLISGRTPFEKPGSQNTQLELASRIQRGLVTPLTRDDVPASLAAVLMKGMDPSPARRYAQATDFARALQGVELELGYHPTPIEVARGTVERTDRRPESGADETRAAGIPRIVAQAAPVVDRSRAAPNRSSRPTLSAPATKSPETEAVGETVVKVTGPTRPDTLPSPGRRQRRRWPLGAGIAAAVVLLAAIAIGLLSGQPGGSAHPQLTSGQPDDTSPVDAIVPAPAKGTATVSADGASVTFTWATPNGEPGDSFVWQRSGGNSDQYPRVPTDVATATVDGIEPGQQTCITVFTNRNGQLSADSLSECTP